MSLYGAYRPLLWVPSGSNQGCHPAGRLPLWPPGLPRPSRPAGLPPSPVQLSRLPFPVRGSTAISCLLPSFVRGLAAVMISGPASESAESRPGRPGGHGVGCHMIPGLPVRVSAAIPRPIPARVSVAIPVRVRRRPESGATIRGSARPGDRAEPESRRVLAAI